MTQPAGNLGGWMALAASVAAEAAKKAKEQPETPEARDLRMFLSEVRAVQALVNQEFRPRVAQALLVHLESAEALRAMVDRAWCREYMDQIRADIADLRAGKQAQAGEAA